jgi:hypothetical protein
MKIKQQKKNNRVGYFILGEINLFNHTINFKEKSMKKKIFSSYCLLFLCAIKF